MDVVQRVDEALGCGDSGALDDAVFDLVDAVADVDPGDVLRIAADLQARRAFAPLTRLADAAVRAGVDDTLWLHLVQALIEQGAYVAAEAVAADAPVELAAEIFGMQGRSAKDRALRTGDPGLLEASIDAYVSGIVAGGDELWLGLNAHALTHLARRRGIAVRPPPIADEVHLLAAAESAAASGDPWAVATWIEAHLLVGLPVPVDALVTRLSDAPPFLHASMRRQLTEVWGLPDDHPAVVTLAELLLRVGDASTDVRLPPDPAGYEKMFGSEWPVPIDTYRLGLQSASSVCHLFFDGTIPVGTGFVVQGELLDPTLTRRLVLLTNEHVVSSPERGDGVPAAEITARFDAHQLDDLADFDAVWWSDRTDLDVTILVSSTLDASAIDPLEIGTRLPSVRAGAHVYVVGHPGGGSLSLSIRGNDLIDHDGVRLHYRAPTQKGSSGSPVFDHSWRLIGVHHRGSSHLPALNNRVGNYEGNEGTTIEALRAQLGQRGIGR